MLPMDGVGTRMAGGILWKDAPLLAPAVRGRNDDGARSQCVVKEANKISIGDPIYRAWRQTSTATKSSVETEVRLQKAIKYSTSTYTQLPSY